MAQIITVKWVIIEKLQQDTKVRSMTRTEITTGIFPPGEKEEEDHIVFNWTILEAQWRPVPVPVVTVV